MNVLVKFTNNLDKWSADEQARIDKAIVGSIYDATYALYEAAWMGLKTGKLGLANRRPLYALETLKDKEIQRGLFNTQSRAVSMTKEPLQKLYRGILYRVDKSKKMGKVGFIASEVGAGGLEAWSEKAAQLHKYGFTLTYTKKMREYLHVLGVHVRNSTGSVTVPARDIMGAVKEKHGGMAMEKLADSFARKMAGERT